MGCKRGLVYGVGINDADYAINLTVDGKYTRCPYYARWKEMLRRCYSEESHNRNPRYAECSVCEEWKHFSNFKKWMEKQEWHGKDLDKDLLVPGNKIYGPDACLFLDKSINRMLPLSNATRGKCPLGVTYVEDEDLYYVQMRRGKEDKDKMRGYSKSKTDAHKIWQMFKYHHLIEVAEKQTDVRVYNSLIRIANNIKYEHDNNLETIAYQ